jgi:hypothetical protein
VHLVLGIDVSAFLHEALEHSRMIVPRCMVQWSVSLHVRCGRLSANHPRMAGVRAVERQGCVPVWGMRVSGRMAMLRWWPKQVCGDGAMRWRRERRYALLHKHMPYRRAAGRGWTRSL